MGVKIVRKPFETDGARNLLIAQRGIPKKKCPCCDREFTPNDRFPNAKFCDSHCLFVSSLTEAFFLNIAKKTWNLPEYMTLDRFPQYLTNLRGM